MFTKYAVMAQNLVGQTSFDICPSKFGDSNGDCKADFFGIPAYLGGIPILVVVVFLIRVYMSNRQPPR